MGTEIHLDLQTHTRLLSDSTIFIYLSKQQFTAPSDTNDISCTLDGTHTLCSYVTTNDGYHKISLQVSCEDGLCPDAHYLPASLSGFRNRYSLARGPTPYEEVYFETFDPTGTHQIDTSPSTAFVDELMVGTASINIDSF